MKNSRANRILAATAFGTLGVIVLILLFPISVSYTTYETISSPLSCTTSNPGVFATYTIVPAPGGQPGFVFAAQGNPPPGPDSGPYTQGNFASATSVIPQGGSVMIMNGTPFISSTAHFVGQVDGTPLVDLIGSPIRFCTQGFHIITLSYISSPSAPTWFYSAFIHGNATAVGQYNVGPNTTFVPPPTIFVYVT